MLVETIIRLRNANAKQISDVEKFLEKKKIDYDKFDSSYEAWVDYSAGVLLNNSLDGSKKIKLREKTTERFIEKNKPALFDKLYKDPDIIDSELMDDYTNEVLNEKGYFEEGAYVFQASNEEVSILVNEEGNNTDIIDSIHNTTHEETGISDSLFNLSEDDTIITNF